MIEPLDHDDDLMAQVRKLTEKVNELVEKHNYPYGRPRHCECGCVAVLKDPDGDWCRDCFIRKQDQAFIDEVERASEGVLVLRALMWTEVPGRGTVAIMDMDRPRAHGLLGRKAIIDDRKVTITGVESGGGMSTVGLVVRERK